MIVVLTHGEMVIMALLVVLIVLVIVLARRP